VWGVGSVVETGVVKGGVGTCADGVGGGEGSVGLMGVGTGVIFAGVVG
jgi:hypothetical protein